MSVIANVSVAPEDFKFARTLRHHADVQIEIERIIPATKKSIPFLWISGLQGENVKPTLESERDVENVDVLDQQNMPILAGITWTEQRSTFLETVAAERGTILDAVAEGRRWNISLRFPSRTELQTFYHRCADQNVYPTINQIHNRSTPEHSRTVEQLSDRQYETLQIALEAGYFAVPREVTIEKLAGELNVSDAAVSQRLRRGIRTVLTEVISDGTRTY